MGWLVQLRTARAEPHLVGGRGLPFATNFSVGQLGPLPFGNSVRKVWSCSPLLLRRQHLPSTESPAVAVRFCVQAQDALIFGGQPGGLAAMQTAVLQAVRPIAITLSSALSSVSACLRHLLIMTLWK